MEPFLLTEDRLSALFETLLARDLGCREAIKSD